MSVVPYTRTHAVNRTDREDVDDVEGIHYGPLSEIHEPVQIFVDSTRNGTFTAPIYEFQYLIDWFNSGHRTDPLTRRIIGYGDIDVVEWIERPNDAENDNYVGNTNRRLAALRGEQYAADTTERQRRAAAYRATLTDQERAYLIALEQRAEERERRERIERRNDEQVQEFIYHQRRREDEALYRNRP